MTDQPSHPLSGLKVVELARILAGPWAGQIFADLGADVVKIESAAGDDTRQWGPPFVTYADGSSGSVHVAAIRGTAGGGNGTVCVRPERLRFAVGRAGADNCLQGSLTSCLHLGASFRCTVKALGRELVMTLPDQAEIALPEPGAQVWLAWGALDGQLLAEQA